MKAVNVTTPMQADLDAGGHSIFDLRDLTLDGDLAVTKGVVYLDGNHNRPSLRWVTESPVTDARAVGAARGSVAFEFSLTPAVWVKTGPNDADWRRLAFDPATP